MSMRKKTVTIFTLAQFGIIFLFSVLSIFSLTRLIDMRDILLSVTEDSVPIITQTALLNNQIESLATLVKFLSESKSSPEKLLAKRKIDDVIANIMSNINTSKTQTQYLSKQLVTIYQEIHELDELVGQKLTQEKNLNNSLDEVYSIVFALFTDAEAGKQNEALSNNLLSILLLTIKVDEQTRLHELRETEQDLNVQIAITEKTLVSSNKDLRHAIASFQMLIVGKNGLVNQKIQSLRLIGRTRGRDNLVRNLIADVASNLQYQSQVINEGVRTESLAAANQVNKQTNYAIWSGIAAVLTTLIIIYFLYRRIVLRLLSLAAQVNAASVNSDALITISGNDEIADLAKSFTQYLQRVTVQEKALLDMALSDPLTGIPNRRAFNEQINKMIASSARNDSYLTVLLVDIDFFKPFNDHYGHGEGDTCLTLVASQLNSTVLRNTDFCARYGGEEFVCLLPNTDPEGAKIKAESLRVAIENLQIPHMGNKVSDVVTVSVGAATFSFTPNHTWTDDTVLEQADKALYQAKADGRNCCRYFCVS